MNVDMRPYAERLAKAMPERFRWERTVIGVGEELVDIQHNASLYVAESADCAIRRRYWAFWGPLLDEFVMPSRWVDNENDGPGYTEQWSFSFRAKSAYTLPLKAVAEAVCQAVERGVNP